MPTYSHSRLSCYEQCPYRYKLRYIDGVEIERQGIEAFTGTLVHRSLQHLYEEAEQGRVLTSQELVEHFRTEWEEAYDAKAVAVVKRGDRASDHATRADAGLISYHRRYHPFDQGRTVGLEQEIRFTVRGEREHELVGYIDRLTRRDDGTYEVHDYKTGRRMPSAQQLRDDRQLTLYEMGVRQNYPDARDVRLVWHYLAHDRELTSARAPVDLARMERSVSSLIEHIESAEDHPCRRGPLCRWCEYQEMCR